MRSTLGRAAATEFSKCMKAPGKSCEGRFLMLQAIMKTLLGYIGKEGHADSLVEKLMLRFEAAVKEDQWKNLAYCLTQVGQ